MQKLKILSGHEVIKDIIITELNQINTPGGNVLHGIKATSSCYFGFGEAYFSQIDSGAIKAWKRHKKMCLNLIVPIGEIKFILFDDRDKFNKQFHEVTISKKNYSRLTVPPNIWVGFQGRSNSQSLLLNIANIEHDKNEVDRLDVNGIKYDWSKS